MGKRKRRLPARPASGLEKPAIPFWLFGLLLCGATAAAYYPAWFGEPLWDDEAHLTRPALQSLGGLLRIWTEPGATQQYYPLVHTAFWIQARLWGAAMLPYHLVNISLHVAAALLFLRLLVRLQIPGAWLAAALFALHPIQVESVAWISELKNTLSTVFALGAALAYLRFAETRRRSAYAAAAVLFLLGLLSKTVIATVPAALLVILWWRDGRISWKRDVVPLLPFFGLGLAAGLFTAWMERTSIGAEGASFDFSMVERGLIAGRAFWFYLAKLFWPARLTFIYPRWEISSTAWWQYLFPAAALGLLALLFVYRRRHRGPLAGALLFGGLLFPAIGFVNVYPFLYSFVADHFQYFASLAIFAVAAAILTIACRRLFPGTRWVGWALSLGTSRPARRADLDAVSLVRRSGNALSNDPGEKPGLLDGVQ